METYEVTLKIPEELGRYGQYISRPIIMQRTVTSTITAEGDKEIKHIVAAVIKRHPMVDSSGKEHYSEVIKIARILQP
jgi:hypothetical protein